MPATCSKCGDCCRAISIGCTKTAVRRMRPTEQRGRANVDFILRHWHRISKAEAERRLPGITRRPFDMGKHFFECDMHDAPTGLCMAHDERPPVCSGFPWYGPPPDAWWPERTEDLRVFHRCSFWEDLRAPLLRRLGQAMAALAQQRAA